MGLGEFQVRKRESEARPGKLRVKTEGFSTGKNSISREERRERNGVNSGRHSTIEIRLRLFSDVASDRGGIKDLLLTRIVFYFLVP